MLKKIFILFIFIEIIFINNCISNLDNNNISLDEVILIKSNTTPVQSLVEPNISPTPITIQTKVQATKNTTKVITKNQPTIDKQKITYVLSKLKENQKGRVAMFANVVLKTYYAQESPQVVKGSIILKRNNKFRIHYVEPMEQYLISNGKIIWIYTPELKQVIKQNAKDFQLDSNFYIELESSIEYYVNQSKTYINEDDKSYIFIMYPRDKLQVNFEKMVIKINKVSLIPEYMAMLYQGITTRVFFYNVRNYTQEQVTNIKDLADSNFEFSVPEDVEEIDASLITDIK